MATFLELQDRVLDSSKRDGLTNRDEAKSLINQTYLELHMLLRPKVTEVTKTLTVDDSTYSIASDWSITDMQALRHIRIVDSVTAQNYLLEPRPIDNILFLQQTQQTAGGSMRYYATDGLDAVTFFPAPSSTTTTATITYVARPADLSLNADVPANIPPEFHDVIALGAIAKAVRIHQPAYYQTYYAAYHQGINDIRRWQNRFGNSMPRLAIVKGSRAPGFPHDNSTYYSGMR